MRACVQCNIRTYRSHMNLNKKEQSYTLRPALAICDIYFKSYLDTEIIKRNLARFALHLSPSMFRNLPKIEKFVDPVDCN